MQTQLAWMFILCFTSSGLCSDVDQDQRVLEEELLSSLFNSKMKQNKQSAPYWRVSLVNLCRMVNSLRGEAWSDEQEDAGELTDGSIPLLEELYSLQHICRALQSREERLFQDSLEYLEDNSDTPLKRKSPYILKRQASHTKSRRPYILKRTTLY